MACGQGREASVGTDCLGGRKVKGRAMKYLQKGRGIGRPDWKVVEKYYDEGDYIRDV